MRPLVRSCVVIDGDDSRCVNVGDTMNGIALIVGSLRVHRGGRLELERPAWIAAE